jgi:tetratricopeptide (TPR) repeat protein
LRAAVLLLAVASFCFAALAARFACEVRHARGEEYLERGNHGLAAQELELAAQNPMAGPEVGRSLGDAYLGLAEPGMKAGSPRAWCEKARDAYARAVEANPLDPVPVFGLARSLARLEDLDAREKRRPGRPALPYYQRAIELRPNGIYYHWTLARYLHWKGNTVLLTAILENLARIYPAAVIALPGEPFWSPPAKEAATRGLGAALKKGVFTPDAHRALSTLSEAEGDYTNAARHFADCLQSSVHKIPTAAEKLRLGGLLLKAGDTARAEDIFLEVLAKTAARRESIRNMMGTYREARRIKDFPRLWERARQGMQISGDAELCVVEAWLEAGETGLAEEILARVQSKNPTHGGWALVAAAAERHRDFRGMEAAAREALAVLPCNRSYLLLLARALQAQGRHQEALRQTTLAMEKFSKPEHWLSVFRGRIYLDLNMPGEALADFRQAALLAPDNPVYFALAGRASLLLGDYAQAETYYGKAALLAPENAGYREERDRAKAAQANGADKGRG